jgi:hypothetical protein
MLAKKTNGKLLMETVHSKLKNSILKVTTISFKT